MTFKQITAFMKSATARLALSYLAIIMLMSIGFSVVFYNASSHALDRQGPPMKNNQSQVSDDHPHLRDPEVEAYLRQRAIEARQALLMRLIWLNVMALAGGSLLSYYLARRTLIPIERNMEAQAQFVSDASHELRTPLTALQTTNEVALRRPKLSITDAKDLLQHNIAEVAKLQALTDGLLRLARQDNNGIVRLPVSLQSVASDAMNMVISAAQTKKIAIEDSVPNLKVLGDAPSLTQVLTILLDNAIKYSAGGSSIKLAGGAAGKQGYISVIDEGQGIETKDMPHIFDRFYRADQSRGKHHVDGYGIGLSLAKKIIHQLDGEIVATSAPGKGSTFTIRLPLAG